MIEKLSPEARTMLSDFLNQIDYEKDKEIRNKENVINDLLKRITILEREVEEHEGF